MLLLFHKLFRYPIKNDNPDKGTETLVKKVSDSPTDGEIKNDNPDKGTETVCELNNTPLKSISIKNDNPDKGTETSIY